MANFKNAKAIEKENNNLNIKQLQTLQTDPSEKLFYPLCSHWPIHSKFSSTSCMSPADIPKSFAIAMFFEGG